MLFGLILLFISNYLWENRTSLAPIWRIAPLLWLIPCAFYTAALIGKGQTFDILARVYSVRVPIVDSIGLTASGLLSNYAIPGNASIPLRTLYMHRVLGLPYNKFL